MSPYHRLKVVFVGLILAGAPWLSGCGTADVTGTGGRPELDEDGTSSHPLYPALDLATLPDAGSSAYGPYEVPQLPVVTREVSVTTSGEQARLDMLNACDVAGTLVTVPDTAGNIGSVNLGNVTDCDIVLGAQVVLDHLTIGNLTGWILSPSHRIRMRGGQIGGVTIREGSSDIVLDGIIINNAVHSPANRGGTGIYVMAGSGSGEHVNRLAVVNSIIRMLATAPDSDGNRDGCAYLGDRVGNVLFANNNIVTAGNRNSWGFRVGGGYNVLIVDNAVRISFHKLLRTNDHPVDYVYVKGGVWMREATQTAEGLELNDAWAHLDAHHGSNNVYIQDTTAYFLSEEPISFGAGGSSAQIGRSWDARRIRWYARSASVISDDRLQAMMDGCATGAICDYGIGTHQYHYDVNLELPADPWRSLPTISVSNPDNQPIAP